MTAPRLLETGTEQERRLLRAARSDGPSARLREHVLHSVNVGALVIAESVTASGPKDVLSTQQLSVGAGSHATVTGSSSIAILVKWVGIAGMTLVGSVGAGFAAGTTLSETNQASVESIDMGAASPKTTVASVPPRRTERSKTEPPPGIPNGQSTQLPHPSESLAARGRPRPAPAPGDTNVSNEVQLVDEARRAMRTADTARCLRLLRERQSRFPQGVLNQEAALIRIEALNLSGQRDTSRVEGLRFLQTYPSGPLANRVKSLLETSHAPQPKEGHQAL